MNPSVYDTNLKIHIQGAYSDLSDNYSITLSNSRNRHSRVFCSDIKGIIRVNSRVHVHGYCMDASGWVGLC